MSSVRWLRRALKRSLAYRVSILAAAIVALWFFSSVLAPAASSAWRSLATRTPLGSASLVPVAVTMSHLSDAEQRLLRERPESVAIHQIRPQLKLVGVGQRVLEQADTGARFEFGLLPEHAEELLRGDSVVSLRVEAPSLELLTQDLFNSPRGQALQAEMGRSRERLVEAWASLWPTLQGELERLLPADLFRQLIEDEVIIEHLREAFLIEVSARLNLEALTAELGQSEALADLGLLAVKHVSWGRVGRSLFGGAFSAGRESVRGISAEVSRGWGRGTLPLDGLLCALRASALLSPFSLSGVLSRAVQIDSRLCRRLREATQQVAVGAVREGGTDLLGQAFQSLATEHEAGSEKLAELAALANERAQPRLLLSHFWRALNQDTQLIEHIKRRYGEEALLRISAAFRQISGNTRIHTELDALGEELKAVAKRGLVSLLLDRAGRGPNPLLLSVIQEQLSGRSRPVIHIIPGSGDAVLAGFLFEHQERGRE